MTKSALLILTILLTLTTADADRSLSKAYIGFTTPSDSQLPIDCQTEPAVGGSCFTILPADRTVTIRVHDDLASSVCGLATLQSMGASWTTTFCDALILCIPEGTMALAVRLAPSLGTPPPTQGVIHATFTEASACAGGMGAGASA